MIRKVLPFLFLSAAIAPAQSINSITAGGLGYTVPIPIESLTAVDGFRTANALNTRFMTLALEKDFVTVTATGTSLKGRTINSYLLSSTAPTTPEGLPKSAAMIQGTIHAREWQSPECAAAIFEWLALESETDPVAAYLLDNMEIVIHPIGNPDGFHMTQTFADKTVGGNSSGSGGRDGRMRRKNLFSTDEDIQTTGDYLNGVDLNRNHQFGFGGGSSSLSSITYNGPSAGSEPESQALYAAAALVPADRLRLYIDIHSHQQLYYVITDGSSDRNDATNQAFFAMRDATFGVSGRLYSRIQTDLVSGAVGATDEYFTGTFRSMSYTLETRPFTGEVSNGFISSNTSIAGIRDEILAAAKAGLYYASGPAVLKEVRIYDTTDGTTTPPLVYREVRDVSGNARVQNVTDVGPLRSSRVYTAALRFNKPMRLDSGASSLGSSFPGISTPTPEIMLENVALLGSLRTAFSDPGTEFGYGLYPGDTIVAELDLRPLDILPGSYVLSVATGDLAGKTLDADATTIADWSPQGWTGWEFRPTLSDASGGADRSTTIPVVNDTLSTGTLWQLY